MTRDHRTETTVAGLLFITATAATMASQMILEPMIAGPDLTSDVMQQRDLFTLGVVLEVTNALASAGIAIALYPILWRCAHGMAVAYVSIRGIEATVGVVAAVGLLLLLSPVGAQLAMALHDWAFVLVLTVFSVSTLVLYPTLYRFRLVPPWLSLWGLLGGLMLLASSLLILFARVEIGSGIDTVLSLPIWINEMALALWLIFRGVDTSQF